MIENQDRYLIDVRRVHQEISNGPTTNCKYCGLYDSKFHSGFVADLLLPDIYLDLSNKGFFRSGKYFWKQNPHLSCCKEFAIRMNVSQFQISDKQKKTYLKFTKLMNEINNEDKKLANQNGINSIQKEIQQINENKLNNQQNINKKIELEQDEKQLYVSQLIKESIKEIFNDNKQLNYPFKIFKTKGKKKDSDYYSNVLQVIFFENKELSPTIDIFIEKYGNLLINSLQKQSNKFIFSIHPQQKLLLLSEKLTDENLESQNKVNKQATQDINKPKEIKQMNVSNEVKQEKLLNQMIEQPLKQNHSKQSQNNNKQIKQPKDQAISQEQNKTKKTQYIKDDGSINFDLFSPRYIKIGNLEVSLEDNIYSDEIYQIFSDYFKNVHQREPSGCEKFAKDKCSQIIEQQIIESKIDSTKKLYTGTFFFKYRLNGELIAVSHVDILPKMFLSQYFFYKPELKKSLSLGINSALIEIEYVKRMQKFFPEFIYFNFVQFIPRTTKMNYKADFQKQEILCPETYRWVDLTLDLKKQLFENPLGNPRLAPKEWTILPDHDFSDMDIESYLYNNFLMYINDNYLMIQDLIPHSQPQIMLNIACILQAMGKTIFNSLTFGYTNKSIMQQ